LKVQAGSQQCGDELVGLGTSTRPSAAAGERRLPSELKIIASILERPVIDETPFRLRWAPRRT
jgi:hypothetical protein